MLRLVALALLVLPVIAMAQSNPGNTPSMLGNRESGMAQLEGAVMASRAALEELTREREPREWASSQKGLDSTLALLAKRRQ